MLLGFGTFIAWIVLLNYLSINDNLKVMTSTINASKKSLFYFLIGCMPFFYAFYVLSKTIFDRCLPFDTGVNTIINLFSISLGDNINDIF